MNRRTLWARIGDAVTGRLRERDRKALFEEIREEPRARADYDLTFAVLRELERAPIAQAELDVVENWLMADLQATPEREGLLAALRRPWMTALLAVAAAAALVVVVSPSGPPQQDDGWQARGVSGQRALAIDVLCPKRAGQSRRGGLVPAAEYGCSYADTLSFAYRLDPAAEAGTLSLFGVDEAGDVLYYAPTPVDGAGIDAAPGTWTPLPMVVALDVNHEPGDVVVYGLVSAEAPSIDQLDAMAEALDALGPSHLWQAPWHERLASHPVLAQLCPEATACESAELTFTIHEAPR